LIQPQQRLYDELPELTELERLIDEGKQYMSVRVPVHIERQRVPLPFYVLEMGNTAPDTPVLILVGGVHGVERIGTQVILAFLRTLIRRLHWDPLMQDALNNLHLLIVPMVNPGGMAANSRCNLRGVDLMRNAPVEAEGRTPWLVGGHRISPLLPWYRGAAGAGLEPESQALSDAVLKTIANKRFSISLDCHSGFGTRDRLWFPYARSTHPWEGIGTAHSMTELFENSFPQHRDMYLFEPQAHSYTTNGDLWDYLYDRYRSQQPQGQFIPVTLEMGSWLWVKKNPRHLFRYHKLFNPVLPHRQQRILRRHLILFEFLLSATRTMPQWVPASAAEQQVAMESALRRWYSDAPLKLTTSL
tara:strand:+ start:194 stop:1267 length:1074 start_codon:yes stop_codon:yes gene_type:complete